MINATAGIQNDVVFGADQIHSRAFWLSPALIGLCAPIVVGLLLAPYIISDAGFLIGGMLSACMVIAVGAYLLSVMAPGPGNTPSCIWRAASRHISARSRRLHRTISSFPTMQIWLRNGGNTSGLARLAAPNAPGPLTTGLIG